MTSEIAFLKIRLLPSQGKFRTRLELMAAVNTKETLKELSIEISLVRMELTKQNLVIISFKKHKLGSALGDPFKALFKRGPKCGEKVDPTLIEESASDDGSQLCLKIQCFAGCKVTLEARNEIYKRLRKP